MTPDERRKVIDTGIAVASSNPLVPIAVRGALAALAEEVRTQGARISKLEHERDRN